MSLIAAVQCIESPQEEPQAWQQKQQKWKCGKGGFHKVQSDLDARPKIKQPTTLGLHGVLDTLACYNRENEVITMLLCDHVYVCVCEYFLYRVNGRRENSSFEMDHLYQTSVFGCNWNRQNPYPGCQHERG